MDGHIGRQRLDDLRVDALGRPAFYVGPVEEILASRTRLEAFDTDDDDTPDATLENDRDDEPQPVTRRYCHNWWAYCSVLVLKRPACSKEFSHLSEQPGSVTVEMHFDHSMNINHCAQQQSTAPALSNI